LFTLFLVILGFKSLWCTVTLQWQQRGNILYNFTQLFTLKSCHHIEITYIV